MTFSDTIKKLSWNNEQTSIYSKTSSDVEAALTATKRSLEDFKALISPAAAPYLEEMAKLSNQLTLKRFGRTIQLYIPLYLSNICENHCTYCGFNCHNKIKRIILTEDEIKQELEVIKTYGYKHLLLVTGESRQGNLEYLKRALEICKPDFSLLSMEVQPLDQHEYKELVDAGLNSVYIYQETYNETNYPLYHPKGKKADYHYRLQTPDRLGNAGIRKIGLGYLIGLEDWRTDAVFMANHLTYLEKTYWATKYSLAFPRLRPSAGDFKANVHISDRELVQLICAFRIFNEEVELSVSTRENANFRNNIIKIGATALSAGSKTEPGGYALNSEALEQFSVNDDRTPSEVAAMIKEAGYEPVWKDWDEVLS